MSGLRLDFGQFTPAFWRMDVERATQETGRSTETFGGDKPGIEQWWLIKGEGGVDVSQGVDERDRRWKSWVVW